MEQMAILATTVSIYTFIHQLATRLCWHWRA